MTQLAKKMPKVRLPYLPSTGHGILKSTFFPLQSDIPITFLCLIVGVGSILAGFVFVVHQKNNNVVVRCQFLPLMLGAIFVRWYF